jgi:hypothetical protein
MQQGVCNKEPFMHDCSRFGYYYEYIFLYFIESRFGKKKSKKKHCFSVFYSKDLMFLLHR